MPERTTRYERLSMWRERTNIRESYPGESYIRKWGANHTL